MHVATGAVRSEPHRPPAVTGRTACTGYGYRHGRRAVRGVPGVQGCRVSVRCAHCTSVDECIYRGVFKARLGQGRCQNQCQDSARTSAKNSAIPHPTPNIRPPDIRHPTTRHPYPPPPMYPGYIVTRCLHNGRLLLPYPISCLTLTVACLSGARAMRGHL